MPLTTYTADGRPKGKGQSFAPQGVLNYKAWTAWNPASSGSYLNHPDGTYTYTCPYSGYYRVVAEEAVAHTNAYTTEESSWTFGGTATRLDNQGVGNDWGEDATDGSRHASRVALFYANAGQTITLLPFQRVTYTLGTHTYSHFHFIELTASSVGVAPEPWHNVGAAGEPAFTSSWVNYGGTETPARFMKDPHGFVHLGGLIKLGTLTASAFTLPAGYRPLSGHRWACMSSGALGYLILQSDGTVVPFSGSNVWFDLSPAIFRAEG